MGIKGTGRTVATSTELMSTLYTQTAKYSEEVTPLITKIRSILNGLQSAEADNLRGGQGSDILDTINKVERICVKIQGDVDAVKYSVTTKLRKTQEMLNKNATMQDANDALAASRNKAKDGK